MTVTDVQNLSSCGYLIDATVDAVGVDGYRPSIVKITRLERLDGEPLGGSEIKLNLRRVASDAAIKGFCDPDTFSTWRECARMSFRFIRRHSTGPTVDDWLVRIWQMMCDDKTATATELADLININVSAIQSRLFKLREQRGVAAVPIGAPGRRPGRPRLDGRS